LSRRIVTVLPADDAAGPAILPRRMKEIIAIRMPMVTTPSTPSIGVVEKYYGTACSSRFSRC
jgi:hypothetical protein